jgi:aspartyl/asparaginyl-tRNA synthetase
MINYSLQDTYTLASNLAKSTIEHALNNNQQDLKNLHRNTQDLENVIKSDWTVITYEKAKSITNKQEIGLSTEEEKYLTVSNI